MVAVDVMFRLQSTKNGDTRKFGFMRVGSVPVKSFETLSHAVFFLFYLLLFMLYMPVEGVKYMKKIYGMI